MFEGARRFLAQRLTSDRQYVETRRVPSAIGTLAGVRVTPDTAITVPTVWACLRFLSQSVAVLPWHVYRETPRGGEPFPTHPVDWLLYKRPNPEWSAFQFRETLTHWALRWGNGYAEIERGGNGLPVALWPIHPERVEVKRTTDTQSLFYRVYNGAGFGGGAFTAYTDLDPVDVFHVRGFGEDVVGVNVVAYAAESIGWARAAQLFGAGFFGEGMNPAGVVEVKGGLKPGAWAAMKEKFRQLYKGPRGERIMFLDQGSTYKAITIEPDKAQFIATNQHLVEEVCRWFGVPPHKVAHLLRSTNNNIEHQGIEAVVDSIAPWVKRFEEEADYKLFGQNRQSLYTKMNMNALMRGDAAARAQYYQTMRQQGVFTANDILRLEDMNTISAADGGDVRVMQGQYMPISEIAKAKAPQDRPPQPVSTPPDQAQLANWLATKIAHMEMEDA